jgi:hypothetical protein
LEPFGFLLGDVASGDDTQQDLTDSNPNWLKRAWRRLRSAG